MDLRHETLKHVTRRHFFRESQAGIGAIALASLLADDAPAQDGAPAVVDPLAAKASPLKATATRVIYLHLTGSPPHLDLFDYKPELVKRTGQECPDAFLKGKRFAFTSGVPKLLGTPRQFARHGESGTWMSDAIPNLHKVADDLCVINSMHTDQFNHAPAELLLYTGSPRSGRPSMGSWVTYGLGTENANLPGFVVLISSGVQPNGGKNSFGSGFLPSVYQGVQCRSTGDPVLYASDPAGMDRATRRMSLDALRDLNEIQGRDLGHPETATRIAQYELAFRMQTSVPEVMDISREPRHLIDAYGAEPGASSFATTACSPGGWSRRASGSSNCSTGVGTSTAPAPARGSKRASRRRCATMDRPIGALIADLKSRGLLDETLIVIGGEFGRTPFREGRTAGSMVLGRDHFPDCYTMVLAGGGVKGGYTHGESDELGFSIAKDPVHVHDLQATILRALGIDHKRLTHRFQGRDYRLTDVHGKVVQEVLA